MKLESLVMAYQNDAVNTFPGLVHTARHITKVDCTRSLHANSPEGQRSSVHAAPAAPDAQSIIQKSVAANQRDFEAGPHFSYTKRESTAKGFKTCRVMMIDGSPYERTIAIGGKPLSHEADLEEERKLHE